MTYGKVTPLCPVNSVIPTYINKYHFDKLGPTITKFQITSSLSPVTDPRHMYSLLLCKFVLEQFLLRIRLEYIRFNSNCLSGFSLCFSGSLSARDTCRQWAGLLLLSASGEGATADLLSGLYS